ncbi:MAG: GNAT family N-acetyltransferase [Hyphomicrobiaceae bacterium]|nr:GNAT family N-acetyltransferase [Hyphomicrobiaceae bacterium]
MAATLTIQPLDLQDPADYRRCRELQRLVFGEAFDPAMLEHARDCHPATFVLGCWDGDRLAGCNGFLAHPVRLGDRSALAYQSCISATHPEYRGRRIFQSLIDSARATLKQRGAAFMFGFPNENSEPIFVKKLGFRRIERRMALMPLPAAAPLLTACYASAPLDMSGAGAATVVTFDARATSIWKSRSPAGPIEIVELGASLLLGRVTDIRMLGRPARLLLVGGYEARDRRAFGSLLAKARRQTGASLAGCMLPADAPLARAARIPLKDNRVAPFIVHPLAWSLEGLTFNAWESLLDIY